MSYKEKLQYAKNNIAKMIGMKEKLPANVRSNTSLTTLDDSLDLLLYDDSSLMEMPVNYIKDIVRLTIILDTSTSMVGTEEDIYYGIKNLIAHHKNEDILFSFVVFNGERKVLIDDVYIGNVNIPEIYVGGNTNLNGSLYYTMKEKCKGNVNLVVTISDGGDNIHEVNEDTVKALMNELSSCHNHFYFLGEPNEEYTPEEVYHTARRLGFAEGNITLFTRNGEGNKLNFSVISKMLEELLRKGDISKEWSKPIKEHYLALIDKRC